MSQAHQSLFKIFGIITKNMFVYIFYRWQARFRSKLFTPPHHFLDSKWSYSTNLLGLTRRYGGRQHNDAGTQNILYDEDMKNFHWEHQASNPTARNPPVNHTGNEKKTWINGLNNQPPTGFSEFSHQQFQMIALKIVLALELRSGSSHLCT